MTRQQAVAAVLRHRIKDAQRLADAEVAAMQALATGQTAHRAIKRGMEK